MEANLRDFSDFGLIEEYTLMKTLELAGFKDLSSASVLDVGCGDGRLCRRLRHLGARKVVGCDSSEPLIESARSHEAAADDPISYQICDILSQPDGGEVAGGPFDLAVSLFVFHMARDEGELARMCAFAHRQLRPGGAAVIFTVSGEYRPSPRQSELTLRHWGYESAPGDPSAGDPPHALRFKFGAVTAGGAAVLNYQYPAADYVRSLMAAGFRSTEEIALEAPPWRAAALAAAAAGGGGGGAGGEEKAGGRQCERDELLRLYLGNPHAKGFLAIKGGVT